MSKQINLTYCGMDATGRTVTEAKQDACRKLTSLVYSVNRGPVVLYVGESVGLVWPDAYGWCSRIIAGPYASECRTSGYLDARSATQACAAHIASLLWSHDVPNDRAFFERVLADLPDAQMRETITRDQVGYVAWQRGYRTAREQGMSDGQAHESAGQFAWNAEDGARVMRSRS